MGYYANSNGDIKLNTESIPDEVKQLGKSVFECFIQAGDEISMSDYNKYYEDSVYEFLEAVAPYTDNGIIFYSGEDGTSWKFEFMDGEWKECSGQIVYDDDPYLFDWSANKVNGLIDQLVEIAECGLKGYDLANRFRNCLIDNRII